MRPGDLPKMLEASRAGKAILQGIPAALRDEWDGGRAWWDAHEAEILLCVDEALNIPEVEIKRASSDESASLRVGDTVEFRGRGAKERFVVAALRWGVSDGTFFPAGKLATLSGSPETQAADLSPGMSGGIIRRLRFDDGPIFYGKQARACYAAFAETVTNTGLTPPPFQEAKEKPEEPEPSIPDSDTDDPALADVAIRHTVQDGTTAAWDEQADRQRDRATSIYHVLRSFGFVQAHTAGGVWRRTNSVGLQETRAPIHAIVLNLHRRGFKVYLDLQSGEAQEAIRRKAEYKRERAERMMARSRRLSEEAGRRLERATEAADDEIRKMPIPGYFPTPPDIAARVAELADIPNEPGIAVLDPSAGHGALLHAVRSVAPDAEADAVEINARLRDLIQKQGFPVVAADIFDPEFQPGTFYDRIVMNPPYEEGATIDHVQRAYTFLRPGGVLVAVVPESIRYREDKRHTAFRAWLAGHGAQEEDLERARFGRAADIKTFILIIGKPEDAAAVDPDERTINRISLARADAERVSERAAAEAARVSGRDKDRLYQLADMARKGDISKAEAAELRALRQQAQAQGIMERAKSIHRSAERVSVHDVSKKGRKAISRPSTSRVSQQSGEYMTEMRGLMAKIKSKVGATELERGWFSGCEIRYILRWERERTKLSAFVAVKLLGEQRNYYPKCEVPAPTGVEVRVSVSASPDLSKGGNETRQEQVGMLEPAGVFNWLIGTINSMDYVQRFKAGAN